MIEIDGGCMVGLAGEGLIEVPSAVFVVFDEGEGRGEGVRT